MTAVSEFVKYIKPWVSGCPDIYIEREVVEAAIKLCEDSFLWSEESHPHAIIKGVRTYELEPPEMDSEPVQLEVVRVYGREIKATRVEDILAKDPNFPNSSGDPTHYYHKSSHTVIGLNKIPETTDVQGMMVTFSLKPKHGANTLPDFIFSNWLQAIKQGALSDLLMMPGKEWANPPLAIELAREFRASLSKARIQMNNKWSDNQLKASGRRLSYGRR